MTRAVRNPGQWPRLMSAATAAAYVDEVSVETFLSRVGEVYPAPVKVKGRGNVWPRETMDRAIDALTANREAAGSLAGDL